MERSLFHHAYGNLMPGRNAAATQKQGLLVGVLVVLITLLAPLLNTDIARAGAFELGFSVSYNKSTYSADSFSWQRRWSASAGYYLGEVTELEFAFQEVFTHTIIQGVEDISTNDRIFSGNIVQYLLNKKYFVQPFVKAGIGQLDREAYGEYQNGTAPSAEVLSLTGILGAGLRVFVTKGFAVRAEATTYLTGGSIGTWKDNVALAVGFSALF